MKARLLAAVAAIILAVSNADARTTCGPLPQVLWSAGMETGDLSEWDDQTNSGSALSVAVTASSAGIPPSGGDWVMRQSVTGTGGTRMARFPEIDALTKAGTTFYVSWWDYHPTKISFGASDTFSIWTLASFDAAGVPNPVWGLYLNGSNSTLMLRWSPFGTAPAEGPHAGESGSSTYSSTVALPVGQWVFFEVMITPSDGFTGAIKVWMNGQAVFDQSLVKTRFPDSSLGGFMYVIHKAHGSNLTPAPAHHYVDDVTVSLGRMPYTPPVPAPEVLWRADMETGDLSGWNDQTISGSALSVAVTASSAGIPPKSGNWVMRQSVTGSSGGTRMARFPEIDALTKAGTTFYVSWWDYYPTKISFGPSDMFSPWQLASVNAAGAPNPVWGLFLNGSNSTLILGWSPAGNAPAEGPHAGESGRRAYASAVAVPVGQWTFFEIMITPSAEFTGAIKIWLNGQVAFDLSQVKTRFPDSALGGFMYVTHNAYGSGLTPTPAHHYVDDVTVSLGRMPYAQ